MAWTNQNDIGTKQFKCSFCSYNVASVYGFFPKEGGVRRIYLCPNCDQPNYFDQHGNQYPGITPGSEVDHLPDDLSALYKEVRDACSVNAHTASVLACRKLLMNIAVNQGAEEGKSFLFYVDYLAETGYVPPNGRGWVDHIRKKGNEATHEIALMKKVDAEELISFSEMLLKFIYEFPNKIPTTS